MIKLLLEHDKFRLVAKHRYVTCVTKPDLLENVLQVLPKAYHLPG